MVRVMALTARMVTIDGADHNGRSRSWTEATGHLVTYCHKDEEGGFARTVLADPVGNELCPAEQG